MNPYAPRESLREQRMSDVDPAPEYVDRWQFDRDHRDLCVCDLCGFPVAPISAGWAHEFSTADELVVSDWSETNHRATVRGHEQ